MHKNVKTNLVLSITILKNCSLVLKWHILVASAKSENLDFRDFHQKSCITSTAALLGFDFSKVFFMQNRRHRHHRI